MVENLKQAKKEIANFELLELNLEEKEVLISFFELLVEADKQLRKEKTNDRHCKNANTIN